MHNENDKIHNRVDPKLAFKLLDSGTYPQPDCCTT